MSHTIRGRASAGLLAAAIGLSASPLFAQTAGQSSPPARRLSVDEVVRLALQQNLGLQIERLNPQIQDLAIAQARSGWVPTFSTTLQDNRSNTPSTSIFSGGASNIISTSFSTEAGIIQTLPTGANYAVAWNGARATSTNFFNSFNPQLTSNVSLSFTQPLLRNLKIDDIRHQVQTSRNDRDMSDLGLQAAIVQTTRNVRNAYWDLTYQIDNLRAQQQSLDLAKQLLSDNEKRVQAGTMASLDIVEAQSEVARNEESVIVADAASKQAEDRLRVLIFDPEMPDFWTVSIEPADVAPFQTQEVDLDRAVRRALEERTDVRQLKNTMAKNDIDVKYFHNQTLPQVDAQASYVSNAVGGTGLTPLTTFPTGPIERGILFERGFSSVLGDVFSSAYPTWTVGVTVAYPIGVSASASGANLARAKLQVSQTALQLKNLELQVAADVRDTVRQVQTNEKRVESARAARDLAERKLDAEQKKYAAGVETNFFVFQAQRDLSQARTDEAQATADYAKSVVDFEAVQQAPLTGGGTVAGSTSVAVSATTGGGTTTGGGATGGGSATASANATATSGSAAAR